MKKKFLAILLAATLSVSVLPVTCIAANIDTEETLSVSDIVTVPEAMAASASQSVKNSIELKWTGFRWISHTSAALTLRTNINGKCYYQWVERRDDGTSEIPKLTLKSAWISTKTDKNFTIQLNDLKTDNAIDLYMVLVDTKGNRSGLKKIKMDQSKRPAVVPAHKAVIPKVTESALKGLDSPLKFYPDTFYPFQVIGAGTTNQNPGEGDVKWEPIYWSTSSNPRDAQKHSAWKIGSAKGITKAATYNLYVFFQKWVYTGNQWTATDTVSSSVYQFRSADISKTPVSKPTSAQVKLSTPSLSGISNSSVGIVLKWKQVRNATGYKIYRKTGKSSKWNYIATVKGGKNLTCTDRSAKQGTMYTYTVRAYRGSALSSYNKSGIRTIRLSAPSQYTPSSKAVGKLTARWKKISAVSGYQIQYSVSSKFNEAKTVSTTAVSKTLSGLKRGRTYYVRIRAYKKTGGKVYYGAWSNRKGVKIA